MTMISKHSMQFLFCKKWLAVFASLAALNILLPLLPADSAFAKQEKIINVLILNSYHEGFQWTDNIMLGILTAFKDLDIPYEFYVEYMDTKRQTPEQTFPILRKLYEQKYKKIDFDIVIISDNNALNFILENRDDLFPRVPVVFCGINNFNKKMLEGREDITGIAEDISIKETIRLALRLHPQTNRIVTINDTTITGVLNNLKLQKTIEEMKDEAVDFETLDDLSVAELDKKLSTLPENTLLLLFTFHRARDGRIFMIRDYFSEIVSHTDLPIYSFWEHYIGFGIVGGVLTTGREQGKKAAEMAIRVLNGVPVETIPVLKTSPNIPMFDYGQLKKHAINESSLPANSVIRNKPPSLYEEHKKIAWSVLAAFATLACLIFFLSINMLRRRQVERELQNHHAQLEKLVQERNIELVNSNQALQKSNDELKKTESLLEGRFRLSELATRVSMDELMQATIDEAEQFTGSEIGFFHFVDEDQERLILQTWSTNTLATMCSAQGKGIHYPISQAGVWVDCFHQRRPVIHQDYASLPHKKGTPDGHAHVSCLLALPIIRNNLVKAIIGVGNKKTPYTEDDIRVLNELASFSFDLIERMQAEEIIRKSKRDWEKTFDAMNDIVTIQDRKMRIVKANKAAYTMFKAKSGELEGKYCYQVFRGINRPCQDCPELVTLSSWKTHSANIDHENLGRIFQVTCSPVLNDNGKLTHIVHIAKDITEQKKMEAELFQAHKMEAIGTLAGGIAHDFNNILAAIIGYAEMATEDLSDKELTKKYISQVLKAGIRAKELVKQILAFSRKGRKNRHPLQPSPVIKEGLKLIRASLPATIEIREEIDADCGYIYCDPTNVHQVMLNLCTNALHAMKDEKGILTVKLNRVKLGSDELTGVTDVSPGKFIELIVSDTGSGMDTTTVERIFDPYFTTKELGKGSGIGLALVHGIVNGCGGFIQVESELDKGSTFHIYFPAIETNGVEVEEKKELTLPQGNERILVIDDEEVIVGVYKATLERLGYSVTPFCSSEEALELFQQAPHAFDLIITDQTMPHLSGSELTKKVLQIRPDIPVILCTGYSAMISEQQALELGVAKYVMKPISATDLASTTREVMDKHKKNEKAV